MSKQFNSDDLTDAEIVERSRELFFAAIQDEVDDLYRRNAEPGKDFFERIAAEFPRAQSNAVTELCDELNSDERAS
jgi:hypothetical protein